MTDISRENDKEKREIQTLKQTYASAFSQGSHVKNYTNVIYHLIISSLLIVQQIFQQRTVSI